MSLKNEGLGQHLQSSFKREMNQSYRNRIRNEFSIEIEKNKYNVFITLNPNICGMKVKNLQKYIDYFYNNMCCRLFRKNKFEIDKDIGMIRYHKYFMYWGFLEFTTTGVPHYHLLAYIEPCRLKYFFRLYEKFWKKIVIKGTTETILINDSNREKIINYCTKKLNKPYSRNEIIFPMKEYN